MAGSRLKGTMVQDEARDRYLNGYTMQNLLSRVKEFGLYSGPLKASERF